MPFFEKLIVVALAGLLFYAFLPVWQISVTYMLICLIVVETVGEARDDE